MTPQLFDFDGHQITTVMNNGNVCSSIAKEVMNALGQPKDAVHDHVEPDCKTKDFGSLMVNELGLYSLVFSSKMERAKQFGKWVYSEVLPSLRKTVDGLKHNQFKMITEFDLHTKVVDFLRKYHPEAILIAGLGENQDTSQKRINSWKKGYQRGTPDLVLVNANLEHIGLVIEFKNPGGTGKTSKEQEQVLLRYKSIGYLTLLCDSYDDAINAITKYFSNIGFQCSQCVRKFKSKAALTNHVRNTH